MRFWLSLLISTNVHVWTVALASLAWPHSDPVLPPEHIEMRILKLPALPEPGDGGEIKKRLTRITPHRRSVPTVEYRVTISRSKPTSSSAPSAPKHDFAAAFFAVPLGTAPVEKSSSSEFTGRCETAMRNVERPTVPLSANPEGGVETSLEDLVDLDPGGDPRPLVEIIQARINEVAPLIHRTSGRCRYEEGTIRMDFRISRFGYMDAHRFIRTSGQSCLNIVAEKVLHMAEPYPYVAGWVPVTIKFSM